MKYEEFKLHQSVCKYLNLKYPHVLFDSDTIASVKLTEAQAYRNKTIQKEGFKRPDIAIYYPTYEYHGLFIELKIKIPYKKDGTLYKNEHLEAQQRTIDDLKKRGYFATFATGFDEAKEIIDTYMNSY